MQLRWVYFKNKKYNTRFSISAVDLYNNYRYWCHQRKLSICLKKVFFENIRLFHPNSIRMDCYGNYIRVPPLFI